MYSYVYVTALLNFGKIEFTGKHLSNQLWKKSKNIQNSL